MDWMWKALLSALAVMVALSAAERCGHRVAGWVSAMPWITAPALGWLACDQGVAFAVQAAISTVAACAMLSAFALLYAIACQRRGIFPAMLAGGVGATTMMLPTVAASASLAGALALALGSCAIAAFGLRGLGGESRPDARRSGRSLALIALAAGGMSVLAGVLGHLLGAFAAGLVASIPVISSAVVLAEHAAGRRQAAVLFLRGYIGGLVGRAAFGAVFALLATRLGVPAALALGGLAAVLSSSLRPRRWRLGGAMRAWRRGGAAP